MALKLQLKPTKKSSISSTSLSTFPTVHICLIPSPATSHFTSTRNLTTHRRSSKTSQSPSLNGSPRFHMTKIHSTKQFQSIKKPLTPADTSTALHFHRQPHQNRQTPIERIAAAISFGTTPRTDFPKDSRRRIPKGPRVTQDLQP